MVACPEPVAIILNRRRRHGGIAEVGVPFRVWTHITRYIPPRGFESIMEALAGDLAEFPRWRRSGVNSNRPRMRTSGHGKGQKQRSHRNPFLHVLILTFLLSPFLQRENCMLSKPAAAGFVARKIGSCHRDQSSRKHRDRASRQQDESSWPSRCLTHLSDGNPSCDRFARSRCSRSATSKR